MVDVTIWTAFARGIGLGGSLIVAIGAQNAYLLKQGLKREHVFVLASLCFVSDATLIAVGCGGFGTLVQQSPLLLHAAGWIGGLFLLAYAARSLRAALRDPGTLEVDGASNAPVALRAAVLTCLAVTWLNPHVYLDTVLLVGSIGGQYGGSARLAFALGAMAASCLWFYGLGYGAAALAPMFRRPITWRVLDALIAVVMAAMAVTLLAPEISGLLTAIG